MPLSLSMVIISGAELITFSFAIMAAGHFEGLVNLAETIRVWIITLIGNILGCLLMLVLI